MGSGPCKRTYSVCRCFLSALGMERGLERNAGRFRTCEVEIHYDRVLTASDDDGFTGFVGESVDLLMRYERRNIDEIAWSGFTAELEVVSPPHASPAANNVKDGFELAVVMRSSLCVGLIGIGAAVTRRPLPHHRAYGSVHGGSRGYAVTRRPAKEDRAI